MAGTATGVEPRAPANRLRNRLLTFGLLLPAGAWYLVMLVLPLVIILIYSFGVRARNGGYEPAFVFDNYARAISKADPFIESLQMSVMGTIGCLLVGLPLAYFLAMRAGRNKSTLLLLLVVPFWTSFLIRTYAWLIILGPNLGLAGQIESIFGVQDVQILGSSFAVLLGLVYGYLPLMVFPLYVTLERMDRTLIEASKDLGAGRWSTFRQVTLPITLPGLVTGSILVFIPMMGEYVIPELLGVGRTYLMGNALVTDFLEARNWPSGAARAVLLIIVMIVTVAGYLWFVNRGRRTRDVSVL
ncbi:MAG TPA: ABC transporter permease [Candidatus Limnocylindrales bacterium]